MSKPIAMVVCGDGINCDVETTWALNSVGFEARSIHATTFLSTPESLFQSQLLVIPGGFSFGDEIASGKILAIKLKQKFGEILHQFIDKGGLILGICNGFQVLTQLGLLPFTDLNSPRLVTLDKNIGGKFINRWVKLEITANTASPFFKSLSTIELPIRHGEGCLRIADGNGFAEQVKLHAPLRYVNNENGSYDRIAALTNSRGNVMGLMPHPEAYVRSSQHPNWTSQRSLNEEPHGLTIFRNVYNAVTK